MTAAFVAWHEDWSVAQAARKAKEARGVHEQLKASEARCDALESELRLVRRKEKAGEKEGNAAAQRVEAEKAKEVNPLKLAPPSPPLRLPSLRS